MYDLSDQTDVADWAFLDDAQSCELLGSGGLFVDNHLLSE